MSLTSYRAAPSRGKAVYVKEERFEIRLKPRATASRAWAKEDISVCLVDPATTYSPAP